ncbi:MAG TPA: hypothetical protein VNT20_01625 [Flavisolibacter sp.]|jgi:hypothetical protein|nr:hypothetical protein [Flavisolibacter sp.]
MTRITLSFLFVFVASFAFSQNVKLTFKNDSDEDFKTLKVSVGESEFKFENLKKGQQTNPITVKETYWFCETTAITAKDTLLFSGFCPVGETLITDGTLMVSYVIYPKKGEYRRLVANEVTYSGSAKNVGFLKITIKDD